MCRIKNVGNRKASFVFGLEPPVLQIDVSGDSLSYETSKPVRETDGEEEEEKEKSTGHSNKIPPNGRSCFCF
jgi:hypothetical protein